MALLSSTREPWNYLNFLTLGVSFKNTPIPDSPFGSSRCVSCKELGSEFCFEKNPFSRTPNFMTDEVIWKYRQLKIMNRAQNQFLSLKKRTQKLQSLNLFRHDSFAWNKQHDLHFMHSALQKLFACSVWTLRCLLTIIHHNSYKTHPIFINILVQALFYCFVNFCSL